MERINRIIFFTWFFFVLVIIVSAQSETPGEHQSHLTSFYKRQLHFGFHLGANVCDFRVHNVKQAQYSIDTLYWQAGGKNFSKPGGIIDSLWLMPLKSIYSHPEGGFNLGIVVDFRLHEYIRLRFLPTLSFASRKIVYTYQPFLNNGNSVDTLVQRERAVESVFLFFPLNVKLQSKRLGNFGSYVIGGASYSIDLQSDKKVDPASQLIRLKRSDFYGEAGGGVDLYMQYFKLAFEIKVMAGLKDILIHDGSKFSQPINRLNSHMVMFTISFEG